MLEEVTFVPSLKSNLMSLGEREKKGYVFKADERIRGSGERCKKE